VRLFPFIAGDYDAFPIHRTPEGTMKTIQISILAAALALTCAAASAQDKKAAAPPSKAPPATEKAPPASSQPAMSKEQKAMMDAMQRMGEVRPEHKQLDYFVGDWSATTTMWMGPKAPPEKAEGKTHTESLYGGRYIEMHYQGTYQGQAFTGEGFIGFDNLKGKFFNTWIDSMSTGFWLAWGSYDTAAKTYTFHGEMEDPMKAGAKIAVRQLVHVVDPGHYTFEWYETHAGKEAKTFQIEYAKQ
jgi:Protein of unknown function (DUF1579)